MPIFINGKLKLDLETTSVGDNGKTRFVELEDGFAVEVFSEDSGTWVRQTEWTEE